MRAAAIACALLAPLVLTTSNAAPPPLDVLATVRMDGAIDVVVEAPGTPDDLATFSALGSAIVASFAPAGPGGDGRARVEQGAEGVRLVYEARVPSPWPPDVAALVAALMVAGAQREISFAAPAGSPATFTLLAPPGRTFAAEGGAPPAPARVVSLEAGERATARMQNPAEPSPGAASATIDVAPRSIAEGGHPANATLRLELEHVRLPADAPLPAGVRAERIPVTTWNLAVAAGIVEGAVEERAAEAAREALATWIQDHFEQRPPVASVGDRTDVGLTVEARSSFLLAPPEVDARVADTLLRAGGVARRALWTPALPDLPMVTTMRLPEDLAFVDVEGATEVRNSQIVLRSEPDAPKRVSFGLTDPRAPPPALPTVRSWVRVDIGEIDLDGRSGRLDVRGEVESQLASLPVPADAVPPTFELWTLPAWAARELRAHGLIGPEDVARIEERGRAEVSAVAARLGTTTEGEAAFAPGTWDVRTEGPLAYRAAFAATRTVALGGDASAIAFGRIPVEVPLADVLGGPTAYEIALPRGLVVRSIEGASDAEVVEEAGRTRVRFQVEGGEPESATIVLGATPSLAIRAIPDGGIGLVLGAAALGAAVLGRRRLS